MAFRTITRINIKKTKLSTRTLMMLISKDIKAVIQSRFRNSIGPDGSHWAGVSYRTGKPLLITGSLMRSFKNSYHLVSRMIILLNQSIIFFWKIIF